MGCGSIDICVAGVFVGDMSAVRISKMVESCSLILVDVNIDCMYISVSSPLCLARCLRVERSWLVGTCSYLSGPLCNIGNPSSHDCKIIICSGFYGNVRLMTQYAICGKIGLRNSSCGIESVRMLVDCRKSCVCKFVTLAYLGHTLFPK